MCVRVIMHDHVRCQLEQPCLELPIPSSRGSVDEFAESPQFSSLSATSKEQKLEQQQQTI